MIGSKFTLCDSAHSFPHLITVLLLGKVLLWSLIWCWLWNPHISIWQTNPLDFKIGPAWGWISPLIGAIQIFLSWPHFYPFSQALYLGSKRYSTIKNHSRNERVDTSCWRRACEERVTESKTRIIFGVPISCYISWPILNSVGQLFEEMWASVGPLSLQVNFHTQSLFIGTPTRCVKSQVWFHTTPDDNFYGTVIVVN